MVGAASARRLLSKKLQRLQSGQSCGRIVRKPDELSQPIADSLPWSFGTNEDVKGWTNAGIIDEDA